MLWDITVDKRKGRERGGFKKSESTDVTLYDCENSKTQNNNFQS